MGTMASIARFLEILLPRAHHLCGHPIWLADAWYLRDVTKLVKMRLRAFEKELAVEATYYSPIALQLGEWR
jgi:hypothetical protein